MATGSLSEVASCDMAGSIGDDVLAVLPDALLVVAPNMTIVKSNNQFRELFDLPIYAAHPGASVLDVADQIEFATKVLDIGPARHPLRARWARTFSDAEPMDHIETLSDGRSISIRIRPLANGRVLVLFSDQSGEARRDADFSAVARRFEQVSCELSEVSLGLSRALDNPLRKMADCAERLEAKHREALTEGGKVYVDRIIAAEAYMRAVLRDFGVYTRLTPSSPEVKDVSLEDLVRTVLDRVRDKIKAVDANVDYGSLPVVPGHPELLGQLIQHVIENALLYRRPDVRPYISVTYDRQLGSAGRPEIAFSISDNGMGFDPQHAEAVFRIFQSVGPDMDGMHTGFGLAACRKIANQHGGSISATSVQDEGTTVTVILPAERSGLVRDEAQDDEALLGAGRDWS
ncbi:MAG: ATP-binding protein [Pseudomonadota bacterium]